MAKSTAKASEHMFDPVDLVMQYNPEGAGTRVTCHVKDCTWTQVLPSNVFPTVARMHAYGVHRQYMGHVTKDLEQAENDLRLLENAVNNPPEDKKE